MHARFACATRKLVASIMPKAEELTARFKDDNPSSSAPPPDTVSGTLQDCLFLTFVVVLSLFLYVHGLGFYSDDWAVWAMFSYFDSKPFFSFLRAVLVGDEWAWTRMRPVQMLFLAALFRLFGLNPFGYHLVNAAVFTATTLFFYLALRRLDQPRPVAVALPMIYAMLPHYSTDRFWVAAFQANLSVCFYFLNLYALLRALESSSSRAWGWIFLSIISVLASSLAYEVAIPLFALNLLFVLYRARKFDSAVQDRAGMRNKVALLLTSNVVALIMVVVFKALVSQRTGKFPRGYVAHIMSLVEQATIIGYISYGLLLPRVTWNVIRDYSSAASLTLAAVLGVIVFCYLYHLVSHRARELPNKSAWLKMLALSFIVFGLGYAIFATNSELLFHKTGIANRVTIAAAIGVAMTFVAVIGWVSAQLPTALLRRGFFCLAIALLSVCGFLINNAIASFWVAAYERQQVVLAGIRTDFPTLSSGSTLILDGVCPYVGPGIVFDNQWDLAGALQLTYRDSTLQADVVRPRIRIEEQGISTDSYGWRAFHPYGENLFLYHLSQKRIYRLTDAETARRYFETFNPHYDNGCPEGLEGVGVTLF